MGEPVAEDRTQDPRKVRDLRTARRVAALGIKAVVVLLPLPAALFTGAPSEIKIAAAYCSMATVALFVALGEIAAGVRRVGEPLEQQHRSS